MAGEMRIGGLLIAFTDASQKDFYGHYWTSDTQVSFDLYADTFWVYWNHNNSPWDNSGGAPLGHVDKCTKTAAGWYVEIVLDPGERQSQLIMDFLREGKFVALSCGSEADDWNCASDGRIIAHEISEASLTDNPGEPHRTRVHIVEDA